MKWKEKLLIEILELLQANNEAEQLIIDIKNSLVNIHLAVFNEPFTSLLFNGSKKIESRFSINKITPFGKVIPNDIILVKNSGGEICGLFRAASVKYFSNLKQEKVSDLNKVYGESIKWDIDPDFLEAKKTSKFLTLIWVSELMGFKGVLTDKKDRTSWVTIKSTLKGTLFND